MALKTSEVTSTATDPTDSGPPLRRFPDRELVLCGERSRVDQAQHVRDAGKLPARCFHGGDRRGHLFRCGPDDS
jgi:hypothetical protein